MSRKNRILVLAEDDSFRENLLKEMASGSHSSRQVTLPSSKKMTSVNWKIDNKYYSAEVELLIVQQSPENVHQNHFLKSDSSVHQTCDAIIFYSDIEPTETLKTWAKEVIEKNSPSILLWVTNLEQVNDDHWDWLVDSGIELISLFNFEENETDRVVSQASQEEGPGALLGPDKVGFGRVIESLETNSWPDSKFKNAVKTPQSSNNNTNNNHNSKEEITTQKSTTTTNSSKQHESNGKSNHSNNNNNSKAIDRTGLPSGTSLLPKQPNRKDYMTIPGKNEDGFGSDDENDEVEPELRNYEFALSQILNFRTNTKHLSQDERLDLAEKLLTDFVGFGMENDEDFQK